MIARGALVALAAVCLGVAVHGLARHDACQDALERAGALAPAQSALAARAAHDVAAHCDEPRAVVVAAAFVDHAGARPAATALARRITQEAPQAYVGWLTLGRLLAQDDPAAARAALARAHVLNPRGAPAPR